MKPKDAWMAIVTIALLTACPADRAYAGGEITFSMQHYAGHFGERCIKIDGPKSLRLSVQSRYPVSVNVHYHVGNDTRYLMDQVVDTSEWHEMLVPATGEYCLMSRNPENVADAYQLVMRYELIDG